MTRRIIYLINPISGTQSKEKMQQTLVEKTSKSGIAYEILPTNATGDYTYLKEKISKENITDIVICGGDGTVSQVAGALINEPVNFGILPMGSGNGLAFAAKISKKIDKALEVIFNGHATYIDAFLINSTFSCMLCGLGFDAQVAHDFAKQKKRGLVTYIKQTVYNFFKAKPYLFEFTVNDQTTRTAAYFISIANSDQFGNQFTIAPMARLNDGLLDIVIVKKMSKLWLLWCIFQQIRNGNIHDHDEISFHKRDVAYFQTSELTIYNLEAAPLHIDGDPVPTDKKFIIKIIPNAFKLLQPK